MKILNSSKKDNQKYIKVYKIVEKSDFKIFDLNFKIGSRNEAKSYNGIVHFIEHSILKLSLNNISLEDKLIKNNISYKFLTTREFMKLTFYGQKNNMLNTLDFLYKDLKKGSINQNDVQNLKLDIKNEIKFRKINKNKRIDDDIHFNLWNSPLGNSIVGTPTTVDSLKLSDIKACFNEMLNNKYMFIITTLNTKIKWNLKLNNNKNIYLVKSKKEKLLNSNKTNFLEGEYQTKEYCLVIPFLGTPSLKEKKALLVISQLFSDPSFIFNKIIKKQNNLVYFIVTYPIIHKYEAALIIRFVSNSKDANLIKNIIVNIINKNSNVNNKLLSKIKNNIIETYKNDTKSINSLVYPLTYSILENSNVKYNNYISDINSVNKKRLDLIKKELDLENIVCIEV